jgi:hypothetical protein
MVGDQSRMTSSGAAAPHKPNWSRIVENTEMVHDWSPAFNSTLIITLMQE